MSCVCQLGPPLEGPADSVSFRQHDSRLTGQQTACSRPKGSTHARVSNLFRGPVRLQALSSTYPWCPKQWGRRPVLGRTAFRVRFTQSSSHPSEVPHELVSLLCSCPPDWIFLHWRDLFSNFWRKACPNPLGGFTRPAGEGTSLLWEPSPLKPTPYILRRLLLLSPSWECKGFHCLQWNHTCLPSVIINYLLIQVLHPHPSTPHSCPFCCGVLRELTCTVKTLLSGCPLQSC